MSLLTALQDANKKMKTFAVKGVRVANNDFIKVAGLLGTKVTVSRKVLPKGSGIAALYDPTKRTLFIYTGDSNFPSDRWQESLFIHEAVHIAGHLYKRTGTALHEEMAAHVAQGMYLIQYHSKKSITATGQHAAIKTPSLVQACVVNSNACTNARITAGTAVAAAILNNKTPSQNMLTALQTALQKDPTYKKVLARPTGFSTGIP